MATLSYVAESHDHLGSISLTLWYQGGTTSKLRLASAGDAAETHSITVGHVGGDVAWKLRMPVSVTKSFQLDIPLSADQERYDVRVPSAAHASPSATQSFIHRPPLSGRELSELKPTSFACSTCSASILTPSPTVTYADLPSEYWTEMLEAWMCHPEGNFLHQLKESRMRPSDGQMLVGNDYLLVAETLLRTSGQVSSRSSHLYLCYVSRTIKEGWTACKTSFAGQFASVADFDRYPRPRAIVPCCAADRSGLWPPVLASSRRESDPLAVVLRARKRPRGEVRQASLAARVHFSSFL